MDSQDILLRALKAHNLRAVVKERGINREKFTYVTSPGGNQLVISWKKYRHPFPSTSAHVLSLDKSAAYEHVQSLGYAVPRSWYLLRNDTVPREILEGAEKVVVKPLDSALSYGVTTDITDESDLRVAIGRAREHSEVCIVQKQFVGEEYRFIIVDGVARSVLWRQKPYVIGDGVSTIEELVRKENEERSRIHDSLIEYPPLTEVMIGGIAVDQRIPSSGERVELGRGTRIQLGASMYDATEQVHVSYKDIASDIGRSIGSGFVVVDMMIQDHAVPSGGENYIFLEYNMSPSLAPMYSCRDGKHIEVAEQYLAPKIAALLQ